MIHILSYYTTSGRWCAAGSSQDQHDSKEIMLTTNCATYQGQKGVGCESKRTHNRSLGISNIPHGEP